MQEHHSPQAVSADHPLGISWAPKHSPHSSDQVGLPESSAGDLRLQNRLWCCTPIGICRLSEGVDSWESMVLGALSSVILFCTPS